MPGPGNYEPMYSKIQSRSRQAMISTQVKEDDRYSYVQSTRSPGPGHYMDKGDSGMFAASTSRATSAKGGNFSMQVRMTEFDNAITQSARGPGPGQYTDTKTTPIQKGPSMGARLL